MSPAEQTIERLFPTKERAEVKAALNVVVSNLMGGSPYGLPTVEVISEFNPT
jgi:hypothetical protein